MNKTAYAEGALFALKTAEITGGLVERGSPEDEAVMLALARHYGAILREQPLPGAEVTLIRGKKTIPVTDPKKMRKLLFGRKPPRSEVGFSAPADIEFTS